MSRKRNMHIGAFIASIMLCSISTASFAATLDFGTLKPNDVVTDQLKAKGAVFLPFNDVLGQVALDTATGKNITRFNVCKLCGFYKSGAHVSFTVFHKTVKAHVGLMPHPPSPNNSLPVTLEAFDTSGKSVGSQTLTLTSGAGFGTEFVVTSANTDIARITIDARKDPTYGAEIALMDLTIDDVVATFPDILLQDHSDVEVIRGGSPVDVTVNFLRLNGSTGPVSFFFGSVPAGLRVTFPTGPITAGDSITFRVTADFSGVYDASKKLQLFASPSPTAGPGFRSLEIPLILKPAIVVNGPTTIDAATCSNPGTGPGGIIAVPLFVTRDLAIKNPIQLSVTNLPVLTSASFSVNPLVYSGAETLASTTMNLAVPPGVVLDEFISLDVNSGGLSTKLVIHLFGTCARTGAEFAVLGTVSCNNAGHITTLGHARVELYKHHDLLYNDKVAEGLTEEVTGRFSFLRWTNKEDDYYVRILMDDGEGVRLLTGGESDPWGMDTSHQNNHDAPLDYGSLVMRSTAGYKTPRCAVFLGGRAAYREYKQTIGDVPPYGQYTLATTPWGTPWSSTDTTHWSDDLYGGYPTSGSTGVPSSMPIPGGTFTPVANMFGDFRTSFHEFAHTIRHSFDGDLLHWSNDAIAYGYAKEHDPCKNYGFGFAFNEGWAEYWSQDTNCCKTSPTDFTNLALERTVARDLDELSSCPMVGGRPKMLQLLVNNPGAIHSEYEFRDKWKAAFPTCPVPQVGDSCFAGHAIKANVVSKQETSGPERVKVNLEQQRTELRKRVQEQDDMIATANTRLEKAIKDAKNPGQCTLGDCDVVAEHVVAPSILRGIIKRMKLWQQHMQRTLAYADHHSDTPNHTAMVVNDKVIMSGLASAEKAILKTALQDAIAALTPVVAVQQKEGLVKHLARFKRQLNMMDKLTPHDATLIRLLDMPKSRNENQLVSSNNQTIKKAPKPVKKGKSS